jgi:NitT/TauT family transport system substrate-binding protein
MRIRLAENFRALFYAPFYATQALGYYAREGVEIEFFDSSVPGDAVAGILDGAIDITWGGPMRVIKARDLQPESPLVCFCEVVARDPFYLVGRSEDTAFRLADLPRLKFAAVSEVPTPWLCLQHDLREQGIDPVRVHRAPNRPMAENYQTLRNQQLDAVQVFEPFPSMALKDGAGRILYAANSRGPTVYTTFITVRANIERYRAAFDGMIRATRHMQQWLFERSAEELAEITAPYYSNIPCDILVSSLQRYRRDEIWAQTTEVSRKGFARLAESLLSGGFISRVPAYEDCVDQSLS